MTTIAFIEDDPAYREFLGLLVGSTRRYALVGAYESTKAALANLPGGVEVVVVDVALPGHSGIVAVARLRERWPGIRCVMLTGSEREADLFAALEAGAAGYLLKSDTPAQILAGLDELVAGGAPLSRSIARRVVGAFAGRARASSGLPEVTRREREIMDQLARGATYKEIGRHLGISGATVKNHLYRVYEKLEVRSRTEAVVKWLGSGR